MKLKRENWFYYALALFSAFTFILYLMMYNDSENILSTFMPTPSPSAPPAATEVPPLTATITGIRK